MNTLELNRMANLARAIVAHEDVSEDDLVWLFVEVWTNFSTAPETWDALVRVAQALEEKVA